MSDLRTYKWHLTDRQKIGDPANKANEAARWFEYGIELAQNPSVPLHERVEKAQAVFARRRRRSACATLYFILIIAALTCFVYFKLFKVKHTSRNTGMAVIYILLDLFFASRVNRTIMNTWTAWHIGLRMERSLALSSQEHYLPSECMLKGHYALSWRFPWYCEVSSQHVCSENGESAQNTTLFQVVCERRWDDAVMREAKPCILEEELCIAEDVDLPAKRRAQGALAAFKIRWRIYLVAAFMCMTFISDLVVSIFSKYSLAQVWSTSRLLVLFTGTICAMVASIIFSLLRGAWVSYHIASRISGSLRSIAIDEGSERVYFIPSHSMLRSGVNIISRYPWYDEMADEGSQDQSPPPAVKSHTDEKL